MENGNVKTVNPALQVKKEEESKTQPIFIGDATWGVLEDVYEGLGLEGAEDRINFQDNAMLAYVKANLRAAESRWAGIVHKYLDKNPQMSKESAELACSKIKKHKVEHEEAVFAKEYLAKKF